MRVSKPYLSLKINILGNSGSLWSIQTRLPENIAKQGLRQPIPLLPAAIWRCLLAPNCRFASHPIDDFLAAQLVQYRHGDVSESQHKQQIRQLAVCRVTQLRHPLDRLLDFMHHLCITVMPNTSKSPRAEPYCRIIATTGTAAISTYSAACPSFTAKLPCGRLRQLASAQTSRKATKTSREAHRFVVAHQAVVFFVNIPHGRRAQHKGKHGRHQPMEKTAEGAVVLWCVFHCYFLFLKTEKRRIITD